MQIGEYAGSTATNGETGADPEPDCLTPMPGDALTFVFDADGVGEGPVLQELGIGKPLITRMAERAAANGTTIERELLSDGLVDEETYYAALARLLRLPYLRAIDASRVTVHAGFDSQLIRQTTVRLTHPQRPPKTIIVPEARLVPELRKTLERQPGLRDCLAIVSASRLRAAAWQANSHRRGEVSIRALFERHPHFSARIVFWGHQGFYTGAGISLALAILIAETAWALLALHVVLSHLYFLALVPRIAAIFHRRAKPTSITAPPIGAKPLPVYTVMIALYREATMAEQLVRTLNRLNWPPSRLDIKFVCEADDRETIEALRAQKLGLHFEIVEVPPMHPRTKPKALTYALAGARGSYLAIYDAEDRPHPDQLREAYVRFCNTSDEVACLQAPLIIANAGASWISALFALEYSALFRGLLPMLAKYRMPLPLGGTSNHFRMAALKASGGWDPYNVTEDADLGMRLYRLGYRSGVIQRQTLEDAPTRLPVWLGQRTRWFKGWLQTWLVLMRAPRTVSREMGFAAFTIFQLQIGGMLISSLLHPLILLFLVNAILAMISSPDEISSILKLWLFIIDCTNILVAYAIFPALGAAPMIEHEKRLIGWRWVMVPAYWMMVSLAAWRAVLELRSNPFFWNKTPHEPASGAAP